MDSKPLISIVCPVYNEEQAIPIFYGRLKSAIAPLADRYDFELIFTNNRSTDGTLDVIRALREKDPSVQVITLSRNFGYQASVLAGISYSAGNVTIVIDVDCEDPPEMIPKFVAKWEEGYDIVYGLRANRPEPRALVWLRKLFYRLLRLMADTDIVLDMAEFALVSSRVRDVMRDNRNTYPFLRAEIGYSGFLRHGITYDREQRVTGRSYYNLWGMTLFAAAGILSVSTFPIRIALYALPLVALANFVLLACDLLGASSSCFNILVVMDLLYGITLLTTHGLYLARIYKNDIGRPVFIIDWSLSFTSRSKLQVRTSC
ncbi:MAG: glycosyltransferase family 2 protein [Terrimicrobiaceae bacterium]